MRRTFFELINRDPLLCAGFTRQHRIEDLLWILVELVELPIEISRPCWSQGGHQGGVAVAGGPACVDVSQAGWRPV